MTQSHEHLSTWIGLAVGLGLAWAGWEWWKWFGGQLVFVRGEDFEFALAGYFYMPREAAMDPWVQPAVIAGLVIVVLLCTGAGALVGRRGTVSES